MNENDLKEQIRILTFRNETLHRHNEKQTQEILELRNDNKKLAEQVDDYINKLRIAGVI
jgi:cell division protein FtsB